MGEETLTDLLVLEMLAFERSNGFRIQQTKRHQEARWGADLLVAIRRASGRTRLLAVQAKKADQNGVYKALNYKLRDGSRQIKNLEAFAGRYRAQALYLFYNDGSRGNPVYTWTCCKDDDVEQLGCTMVPSWRIHGAIECPGRRTFDAIHQDRGWRPWRCAFDCKEAERHLSELERPQMGARVFRSLPAKPAEDPTDDEAEGLDVELPDWWFDIEGPMSTDFMDEVRMHVNEAELGSRRSEAEDDDEVLYPRRFLVVDYREHEEREA